jgi:hypothetical protein
MASEPNAPDIGAGLQRAMRDALREVSGMKVEDADARDVILRLRKFGAEVVYTSQVDQWGEMANCCTYRETGKQCSYCRCHGKNMP